MEDFLFLESRKYNSNQFLSRSDFRVSQSKFQYLLTIINSASLTSSWPFPDSCNTF